VGQVRLASSVRRRADRLHNTFSIFEDNLIPKIEHTNSLRREKRMPLHIAFRADWVPMDASLQLHSQLRFRAVEIQHVAPNTVLTSKL